MYSRSRPFVNQLCKNVMKTANSCAKSPQQNSIVIARRFHEPTSGIITTKKIHESNFAYTDLFADCKSVQSDSNKLPGQIRSELLHSNLESLPLWRYTKLAEDSNKKCSKTRQLMHKSSFLENFLQKYRLSCYQEYPEISGDSIESELFDVQHILDPSHKLKIFRELVEELKHQREKEKFGNDTSGPIIWNTII